MNSLQNSAFRVVPIKVVFVLCSLVVLKTDQVEAFATLGTPRNSNSRNDIIPQLVIPDIRTKHRSSSSLYCVDSASERRIRGSRQSSRLLLGGPLRSAVVGDSVGTTTTSTKAGLIAGLRVLTTGLRVLLAKVYLQTRKIPVWWPWLGLSLIILQSSGMTLATKAFGTMQSGMVWYSGALDSAPIITKAVTAGVIGVLGDYFAQALEVLKLRQGTTPASRPLIQQIQNRFTFGGRYNPRRGLSIMFDGLFISGPLLHYGFEMFEHFMPISNGGGIFAALTHVVADTILLDSVFVASQFWVTGLFEGFSVKETWNQFKSDYVPTLKAGGLTTFMMSPIELLCFRFLPLSFRVLAVNLIDIVWDAVISFMTHKSRGDHAQQHSAAPEETFVIEPAVTFLGQISPITNSSLTLVAA